MSVVLIYTFLVLVSQLENALSPLLTLLISFLTATSSDAGQLPLAASLLTLEFS